MAVRAYLGDRARLRSGATADGAGTFAGQSERHGRTVDRVAERQCGLCLHVRAAPRPARRTTACAVAEDTAYHITEALAVAEKVAEVEGRAASAGPCAGWHAEPAKHRAGLVVLLALLLVGQHVVGFGDFLEALLRVCASFVRVGVILPREFTVGFFDLGGRRGLLHTERLVVVLLGILRAHLASLGLFSCSLPRMATRRRCRFRLALWLGPRPQHGPAAESARLPCSRAGRSPHRCLRRHQGSRWALVPRGSSGRTRRRAVRS